MSGECITNIRECITVIGAMYHYHLGVSIQCVGIPPAVPSVIGARSDLRIKRQWRKINQLSAVAIFI